MSGGWNIIIILAFAIIISVIGIARNMFIGLIVDKLQIRDVYKYIGITLLSYIFYVLKYIYVHKEMINSQETLFNIFIELYS